MEHSPFCSSCAKDKKAAGFSTGGQKAIDPTYSER
jgi:hypothetical protein